MKGVILDAFKDMIKEKYGGNVWEEILKNAGFDKNTVFPVTQDIPDGDVERILNSICKKLGLNFQQVADMFGEYWITIYMPKLYKSYYRGIKDAREFLLKVNDIHRKVTENNPGANPPYFEYFWREENVLTLKYISQRKFLPMVIGLIKGVGKLFKTNLKVKQLSDNEVEIIFT